MSSSRPSGGRSIFGFASCYVTYITSRFWPTLRYGQKLVSVACGDLLVEGRLDLGVAAGPPGPPLAPKPRRSLLIESGVGGEKY